MHHHVRNARGRKKKDLAHVTTKLARVARDVTLADFDDETLTPMLLLMLILLVVVMSSPNIDFANPTPLSSPIRIFLASDTCSMT